jgi:predicted HicB family RNase H-like nuclease
MTKTSYPLKLPASVKAAAQRLAREDGVSLNQWIAAAVAEKNRRGRDRGRVPASPRQRRPA